MLGIKKIVILTAGKTMSRWAKLALSIFFVQFFGAGVYLYYEIEEASLIASQAVSQINNDLIIYHFFKLLLLVPIVVLSMIFTITGLITKWDFDFEQELIEVSIIVSWLILGIMNIFIK